MKNLLFIFVSTIVFTFCKAQNISQNVKKENPILDTISYKTDLLELILMKKNIQNDSLNMVLFVQNRSIDTIYFDKYTIDYQDNSISLLPDLGYRLPIRLYEIPPNGKDTVSLIHSMRNPLFALDIGIIYKFESFMDYSKSKISVFNIDNKELKFAWFKKYPREGMVYINIKNISHNFDRDILKIEMQKY